MGFTTWRLQRRIVRCEKSLAKITKSIERVRAKQAEGKITRAQMSNRLQDLEAKAREQHGIMSTVLGNLRKARLADKRSGGSRHA